VKVAVALWILHAHAHDAARISPILLLSSPTRGCGKTTLLDVIEKLVPRPLPSANCTAAVLYRSTATSPTILLDEADLYISQNPGLVNFLNAGHRKGGKFRRCEGDDNKVVEFDSWAPKAVAQIGKPRWPQLVERSIVVTLRRKRAGESVESLDENAERLLAELQRKARRWATDHLDALREARPRMPERFENRLADNWRALFAIADRISPGWGEAARDQAERLSRNEEEGRDILLLRDHRELFDKAEEMTSQQIVNELVDLEERPWRDCHRGKSITPNWLAAKLKPFGIHTDRVRPNGSDRARGYRRGMFIETWERYLAPRPGEGSEDGQGARDEPGGMGS
jgi:hypothetical protein